MKPIKYSDAKSFEVWLPHQVLTAIGSVHTSEAHLAITQDDTSITYYVNGQQVHRIDS